jgi:serine/threonine-protein kinase ULK4
MKLLKNYKQSALRSKMCEILGLLIRHATSIDPDILKFGIIAGFMEALKDKSEKVRRKAMAALGELLFYGATQVDEKVSEWDLSMNLIHSLLKLLKNPSEDEIVKIYCCKSIENITAQAKEVGLKFAQFDTLQVLASCFNSTKNEGFRSSICCTIHHILQLNPTLR